MNTNSKTHTHTFPSYNVITPEHSSTFHNRVELLPSFHRVHMAALRCRLNLEKQPYFSDRGLCVLEIIKWVLNRFLCVLRS